VGAKEETDPYSLIGVCLVFLSLFLRFELLHIGMSFVSWQDFFSPNTVR
jgi:hypothetical protein